MFFLIKDFIIDFFQTEYFITIFSIKFIYSDLVSSYFPYHTSRTFVMIAIPVIATDTSVVFITGTS